MSSLDTSLRGHCVGGEVNLSRYPNLCYSPDKGIHTHLAGVLVDDVAKAADSTGVISKLDAVAKQNGVCLDELLDAIRYARANKLV